ncbi:MAG: CarboxypepD reg-like domain, partial [Pyrinomonadaceae bacterium]|nr:CarboxypepD reg-like domain [Pyrinomonadaceae bacterium]
MNERLKHPNAVLRFHVVRFRLLVRHLLNGFALLPFSCVILFAINSQTTVAAQTTAQASQRIAGVVLDQADAPVNGAEVSLMSGASELAGTITDEAGEFSFDAFAAREALSVVVRARGFQTLEQSWSGEKIGAAGLRLVLAPAPLSEELTVTATRTQTRLNETAASVVTLSAA